MIWYCENPKCDYSTNNRNKINNHHIIPKELKGSDKSFNRVFLCPNCHSLVFVPNATQGNHSIKSDNSFIIEGWLKSTSGTLLKIIDINGEAFSQMKNL